MVGLGAGKGNARRRVRGRSGIRGPPEFLHDRKRASWNSTHIPNFSGRQRHRDAERLVGKRTARGRAGGRDAQYAIYRPQTVLGVRVLRWHDVLYGHEVGGFPFLDTALCGIWTAKPRGVPAHKRPAP